MKDQAISLEIEPLSKLIKYDKHMNAIVFSLVSKQFSHIPPLMHPDIVYTIKGFLKLYSELLFLSNYPIDLEILCNTLVERTHVIAEHSTIPILTEEFFAIPYPEVLTPTNDQLEDLLIKTSKEITDDTIQESIVLLKQNIYERNLPNAVVQGLLNNLRRDPHCKWAAYLYELYMEKTQD
ncbi:hypothetical protein F9U64_14030 [Gracilibacillus oryzae]|uniref:Uncharacterized protein n=1 Tax=Gracilibacillus oryzae TaxID=1672701 RepID=A0A7C8GS09_9BACI|nr:hypothetical protein [Gracilibacillus oryzae]KAB8130746.1 hypothetical protein F9U64_14030 [Gracilibacillus oryzae]